MTRLVPHVLLAALLVLPLGLAPEPVLAQAPPAAVQDEDLPARLQDILERALAANPEVLLAEARLREAQAELERARLDATRRVLAAHAQQGTLALRTQAARAEMKRMEALAANGAVDDGAVRQTQLEIVELEGQLASLRSELRYLAGIGGRLGRVVPAAEASKGPAPAAAAPSRPAASSAWAVRLDMPIATLPEVVGPDDERQSGVGLDDLGDTLRAVFRGETSVLVDEEAFEQDLGAMPRLQALPAAPLTVAALLAYVSDVRPDVVVVLRDYGMLITTEPRARAIHAPTVPQGVPMAPDAR